jgi:carboxymethylenebutenolidase
MPGRNVKLNAVDGGIFTGYLAEPAKAGPGLVVLQEIFGVNAYVRSVCDRFAEAGYLALAPDLFWRQEPGVQLAETDREKASQLMGGLDLGLATADANAAAQYLRAQEKCSGPVGAVGYCLGGKLAFLMSTGLEVKAAVSYYGVGIQSLLDKVSAVNAHLLLHIAEADALCPPEAQTKIAVAVRDNPKISLVSHAGVGHAFARTGSAAFDPAAAACADSHTAAFLQRHLS